MNASDEAPRVVITANVDRYVAAVRAIADRLGNDD